MAEFTQGPYLASIVRDHRASTRIWTPCPPRFFHLSSGRRTRELRTLFFPRHARQITIHALLEGNAEGKQEHRSRPRRPARAQNRAATITGEKQGSRRAALPRPRAVIGARHLYLSDGRPGVAARHGARARAWAHAPRIEAGGGGPAASSFPRPPAVPVPPHRGRCAIPRHD